MRFLKGFVTYLLVVLALSVASYLMRLRIDVGQICGVTLAMWVLGAWLASVISTGLMDAVKDCSDIAIHVIKKRLKDDENSD